MGISKKQVLKLSAPTEEDNRSDQVRILEALKERGYPARMTQTVLRKLYAACSEGEYEVTASLAWNGGEWYVVDLEPLDTTEKHYGIAADLGSTTIILRLINCNTGETIAEESAYNRQIAFGTDILTRIFACKDQPEVLEEIRKETIRTFLEILSEIEKKTGVPAEKCISAVISGNTTMMHFFLGMDPFCVFSSPYAVHSDRPGFLPAKETGLPFSGFVFCVPGKSNYLGGDIISGMIATDLYKKEEISVFFDIGTNGELVVGNREFLLCGAGAAGPALEGGVVKTGMRAAEGAVDRVRIEKERILCHVMGESEAKGICGSGIVDLLAQLFLSGWMDVRGKLIPEKSRYITETSDGQLQVEYAPGLFFYQSDIDEFVRTKAAAYTMVEYMMRESGLTMDEISGFYAAGAFGKHVDVESAVTIGMYPDIDRKRLISAGNTSLEGAEKLLLDRSRYQELDEILEKMVYIQFGAVSDFLSMMTAAQAIPHTDLERFPSVIQKLHKNNA